MDKLCFVFDIILISGVFNISTHRPAVPLGRVGWFGPITNEHLNEVSSNWAPHLSLTNLRRPAAQEVESDEI